MWRIITLVAVLAVSLAPVGAMAAPDDRGGQTLAMPAQVVADREAQQIAELQVQLATVTGQRDQLQQQVSDLQGKVDSLKGQLAAMGLGMGSGPPAVGSVNPGKFAFGYCTWYVATRRPIPWSGNAIDWWYNARAMGFAEGYTPRVGAIMVTRDSWWGHVALVEQVNADGSWVVSEMNYVSWDFVDFRRVWPGGTLLGFIY